jgi:hypothetical protein
MKPPPADPITRYLATVNRLAAERRKEIEDKKLATMKRKPWWLTIDQP